MNYKSILLFILVTFISCRKEIIPVQILPGQTNLKTIALSLDRPVSVERVGESDEYIYIFKDYSLTVRGEVVSAVSRRPSSNEEQVQFWLHKYHYTQFLIEDLEVVNQSYKMMNMPDLNTKLLYEKKSGKVQRIIHYENK